ncbi:MAG: long-chain fatty acid--CoA ligase, partial [Desulfobacca sp.]|nr:long-chain fatty acid--CoA ligase [Desulfobacca sp.]
CQAFLEQAQKTPRKTAVFYLGTSFTYARILRDVRKMSSALTRLGIKEGDKVIIYIPNSIQWIISWLAVQWIGATAVPITPIYTSRDLEYIAEDTGAAAIFCADRNFGYVKRVLEKTKLQSVIITNLADLLPWWKRWFGWAFDKIPKGTVARGPNIHFFRSLLKDSQGAIPEIQGGGDRLAEILYTGGTTKHPKGVPISHRLYLGCTKEQLCVSEPLFPKEENVILGGAPLFHILGQTCSLGTLLLGGTIIVFPKVQLDALMHAIERYRAKTLIGVPALYRMILEHDRLDLYDLSSLQYCFNGGDVLPLEIEKRWRRKFNKPLFQGYGATETCGGVTMGPADGSTPPQSMGRVLTSKTVRIIDFNTLEVLPSGEPGELIVSSDPMVSAYWNKPEETAEAFIQLEGRQWYRT